MDTDPEPTIQRFEIAVKASFAFLVTEYSYVAEGPLVLDADHPRDTRVVVRYLGTAVAVEAQMVLGSIVVALYELENGTIPFKVSFYGDQGYARAINLDSLVRTVTQGVVRSPLPELPTSISNAEMIRRVARRSELLRTNMEEIVQAYAERLRQYAADILKGDTSIFPAVQQHHNEFYNLDARKKKR